MVDTPTALLEQHLRADAPQRERAVARTMALLCSTGAIPVTLLATTAGWTTTLPTILLLVAYTIYYVLVMYAIDRGHYRPAIALINVAIEASFPLPFLMLLAIQHGGEAALGAAINLSWAGLVMLSALRTNRHLSLFAGAIAAVESALFFFFVAYPLMPNTMNESFSVGEVLFRSFFLLAAGFAAATIGDQLVRQANKALLAVRGQDMMGKYVLHERLGRGGMGEVMRATYCPGGGFEKEVAIKRLLSIYSSDREFVEQFRHEAMLASSLQHPNIVQVFDAGLFEGQYFLAMEYIEGLPLQRIFHGDVLPLNALTYLGVQIAQSLEYLHTRRSAEGEELNLVHRDINPPNILVSTFGEAKVTDFGIARAQRNATRKRKSGTHEAADEADEVIQGKLHYMAPEQLHREHLDARTDLFALGLILHEGLTGKRVLQGEDMAEVCSFLESAGAIVPPSAMRSEVPAALDSVVMSLLSIDPAGRPQRAREVVAHLRAIEGEAAPFPEGQLALRRAVCRMRVAEEKRAQEPTAVPGTVRL